MSGGEKSLCISWTYLIVCEPHRDVRGGALLVYLVLLYTVQIMAWLAMVILRCVCTEAANVTGTAYTPPNPQLNVILWTPYGKDEPDFGIGERRFFPF